MKYLLIPLLIILFAVLAFFIVPIPQNHGLSLTFDPGGVFFTTTTVPVDIGSTTYALVLTNPSSTIHLGLVAANITSQEFINNNGNFVFQILNPSSTQGESGCQSTASCTVDVTSLVPGTGTYPFAIYMAVGGVEGSVTGTLTLQ